MSSPNPLVLERSRLKRRNTAITVLLAAALCVVAVVVAVNSLRSVGEASVDPFAVPGSTPAGGQPAPTGSESAPADAEPPPPVTFSSPTGNIGCLLSTQVARCDLAEREWEPPAAPETCTETWGQGLTVGDAAAGPTCARSSVLGAEQLLDYGRSVSQGVYTCTSSESGMRCENTATGHGFSVSRQSYTLF